MIKRKTPFTVGEWYHCYNRTLDKRISFEDSRDYHRFLELLYLANDESPLRRNDLGIRKFEEIVTLPRGKRLVSLGAFCLMPNHFHLVVKEISEGGITTFMRKMGTAYTLYFNARYKREGNLFLKPFQSIHTTPSRYSHLINYVHCTPAGLYEPGWKTGHVVDYQFVSEHLTAYPYSSLGAYYGAPTPANTLLDTEMVALTHAVPIQKMLSEAQHYSATNHVP